MKLLTKLILTLSAVFVAESAQAQQKSLDDLIEAVVLKSSEKMNAVKGRVAVMDFPSLDGKVNGLSAYVSNKVANKLIESNRQVVDRATLEKIFAEQRLQQSASMDTSTAARIGKLAGAGVFVMGSYTDLPSKLVLTLRALSVETGQYVAVAEESIQYHPDLKAEVEYLVKKSAPQPSIASNGGGSSESEAADDTPKASAFDNWLCSNISSGLTLATVFKKALEQDEYDNDDVKACSAMNYRDSAGEEIFSFRFDHWYLNTTYGCEDSAINAIKGRSSGGATLVKWAYVGSAPLKDEASCLPHGSEMWTEGRAKAKKAKKK